MSDILQSYDLLPWQWGLFAFCALLIGMAKTGLSGIGLVIVPLLANVFGGKVSVGLVLVMLIIGDIFGVWYYHRHANWKQVLQLMPAALLGVVSGWLFGNVINDVQFKKALAIIVLIGVLLIVWQDLRRSKMKLPDHWSFSSIMGLGGGFTSMLGNAAGPIMNLYLLSMRHNKNTFIGTAAWFFFIINLVKTPFHIFSWGTINKSSLTLNLVAIPFIVLGALLGFRIVKRIPEKAFRIFIIISTLAAAFFLF